MEADDGTSCSNGEKSEQEELKGERGDIMQREGTSCSGRGRHAAGVERERGA